jgi:hypothetical protein
VPMRHRVPAGMVVPDDRKERASSTGNIQSLMAEVGWEQVRRTFNKPLREAIGTHLVLSSCTTFPFRRPLKSNSRTLPTRSGLARTGPIGQNLSKPFRTQQRQVNQQRAGPKQGKTANKAHLCKVPLRLSELVEAAGDVVGRGVPGSRSDNDGVSISEDG